MTIIHVESVSHLATLLQEAKAQLVVIDFHATWCGPCHQIAPRYESLAQSHPHVRFLKCDVDAAQDVARKYSISAMPTFLFLKDNKQVDLVRGANARALEQAIKKHASFTADDAAFLTQQTKKVQGIVADLPAESEAERAERARAQKDATHTAHRLDKGVEVVVKTMADGLKAMGNNFMKDSRASDAVLCYSEALRLDPDNLVYRNNRAQAALQGKRWSMAFSDAAIVVSKEPSNTKAWIRLGKALRSLGRVDEAIEAFTAAAVSAPSSAATAEIAETEHIKASHNGQPLPEGQTISWELGLKRTEALVRQLEEDFLKSRGVFSV
ncbi:peptide-N(4)-(N-acetyl-beta-glucosaminyl)asparagine amidase [Ceratobasidium sp. AG-Ba]|nr:peptide-N(4)-(N-acetyl-beta-glucosaminyl)asparagine amidase [Ceratobasidium sp. AG-Ba]